MPPDEEGGLIREERGVVGARELVLSLLTAKMLIISFQ